MKSPTRLLALLVMAHGLLIIGTTLTEQVTLFHHVRISNFVVDLPLLIGMSLVYIGSLLRRRKRTAWTVAILAYTFYVGVSASELTMHGLHHITLVSVARSIVLPLFIVACLFRYRDLFVVRSDIQGFRGAARFAAIIILAALLYGVAGFQLLDKSDFHQEIGVATAVHYTIDQFDLTTARPLHAYTKRADLFSDSLTFVSVASVSYALLALFQPLRGRLTNQANNRQRMLELMQTHGAPSEDFFKLWPHDKQYYFTDSGSAGLAFHVSRGVALCIGDPVGLQHGHALLLQDFNDRCFTNDWLPAFIHVTDAQRELYESQGYSLQKIGEEAVLDLAEFTSVTVKGKYFRQIGNKFSKQDYSYELLSPPHHQAVVDRLKIISDEWLSRGGRAERGFAMGYFTPEYMQQCQLLVARDAAGTIQGFINRVPAPFDTHEATFDLMRHSEQSPGNINDYMLTALIRELQSEGYTRLNLGLCPLVGFSKDDDQVAGLIDTVFKFAYLNGDRFYSFSGLHRFKSKYKPIWSNRYIAYQGGVRGFSRTTSALVRAMRVRR